MQQRETLKKKTIPLESSQQLNNGTKSKFYSYSDSTLGFG